MEPATTMGKWSLIQKETEKKCKTHILAQTRLNMKELRYLFTYQPLSVIGWSLLLVVLIPKEFWSDACVKERPGKKKFRHTCKCRQFEVI